MSSTVRSPLAAGGVARLAAAVLRAERVRRAALSVTFVGPRRIRAINRAHRGRDRETDVIAFALEAPAGAVVGDVYCAPAVAARAARRLGVAAKQEIRRLVVHGVLHVLGYDHPDGAGRTASAMWRRQERYLAQFGRLAR